MMRNELKIIKCLVDPMGILQPNVLGNMECTIRPYTDAEGTQMAQVHFGQRLVANVIFGIDGSRMVSTTFIGIEDNVVNNQSVHNVINAY